MNTTQVLRVLQLRETLHSLEGLLLSINHPYPAALNCNLECLERGVEALALALSGEPAKAAGEMAKAQACTAQAEAAYLDYNEGSGEKGGL